MHSRVTSLPERAFSKAFNGLLEKLGAEAARKGAERRHEAGKNIGENTTVCVPHIHTG